MARCLKLLRELPEWKSFAELYQRGDEYIIVSTVIVDFAGDPLLTAFNSLTGAASDVGMIEYPVGEVGEEETQAIAADKDGNPPDPWEPIAVAVGEGSREKVMAKLREDEDD